MDAAPSQPSWKTREWERIAGEDDKYKVDERLVVQLLHSRDDAREEKDFVTADALLDQLADMGVSVNDAWRQRKWWVGRCAEDKQRKANGSRAQKNRRSWYRNIEDY